MSLIEPRAVELSTRCKTPSKITTQTLQERKRSAIPISSLTAYDYPTARLVDEAGVDMILVGDSLAMAVLGHENTLAIGMEEMLHHVKAVRRAVKHALLVADMPYGSYHVSGDEAVANALRFIKVGAEAVKLEGGGERVALVKRMTEAEVSVVGHLGLTPQSVHRMGGYKVQGKTRQAIERLYADAAALQDAGAVAIVLEGVPREVAANLTAQLEIPTIGIGAGPDCDGQILVFHDLFHMTFAPAAKFVRRFGDAAQLIREGVEQFKQEVCTREFPSDAESYHLSAEVREKSAGLLQLPKIREE